MSICSTPGGAQLCHAVGGATKAVAGDAFQAVVDSFANSLVQVMKALMTFWINIPETNLTGSSSAIASIDKLTRPLVAFAAVLGLLVAGVRMAWTARHEQSGQAILRGLLLMTVVSAAGAGVVELLLSGFDALATHILNTGFVDGQSVGARFTALAAASGATGGLLFILSFFGIIASLVQVVVMLLRGAVLAVLVGVLPVAAGAAITDAGYAWFKRLAGWILSFCLYKLTAGVIYATAFALIGGGNDLASTVSGFGLIILAILALPALLRLVPPAAEAMGGGAGGALAGALAAGATGAVALSGGRTSTPPPTTTPGLRGDGGPVGGTGPTGANGVSGRSSAPALPPGGTGGGVGTGSGGAAVAVPAMAGSGAGGVTAAAGGPAGAVLAAGQAAHSAAKSAANGAVGEGSGT